MDRKNAMHDSPGRPAGPARRRRMLLLLPPLAALAGLALFAACGGDDDSTTSPTPTGSGATVSASLAATQTATPGPTAEPGSPTPTPGPSFAPDCAAVGLTSKLDVGTGQFQVGDPIPITMTLKNCGDNVKSLFFNTGQRYEFFIEDDTGVEVWRYSDGKTFEQATAQDQLAVGEERTYHETWDQEDTSSQQVPAGRYKIYAFSIGCSDAVSTNCTFGPVSYVDIK